MTVDTVDVVTGEVMAAHPYDTSPGRDTFGILGDAVRLAEVICDTELVPQVLRNRADAVAAVILAGHELGLGPMQSLQTIDLIQGRPALSPEGMRALILAKGHGLIVETEDDRATIKCHRREWPGDLWTAYTFTMADAERAGLTAKENWVKYPRAMLTARATAEAGRATFADVLAGLSYTPEEIESFASDVTPTSSGGTAARRRGRRSTVDPEAAASVPVGHDPAPTAPTTEEPPPAAPADVADLTARLEALPLKDREAFKKWRRTRGYPPPAEAAADVLAVMAAEVGVLEARLAEEREAYAPPVGSSID
jgi:hypothetical protein